MFLNNNTPLMFIGWFGMKMEFNYCKDLQFIHFIKSNINL